MTHRAEVLLKSDEFGTMLGNFETAPQARAVCAHFEGSSLAWSRILPEVWEARGKKHWYRVFIF